MGRTRSRRDLTAVVAAAAGWVCGVVLSRTGGTGPVRASGLDTWLWGPGGSLSHLRPAARWGITETPNIRQSNVVMVRV